MDRSHVVLLGAGASRAVCPNGDRFGRTVPLQNELVDVVGLGPLLDEANLLADRDDFEKLYSDLATAGSNPQIVARIEQAIFEYFDALSLRDEPTIYDHLVLS